ELDSGHAAAGVLMSALLHAWEDAHAFVLRLRRQAAHRRLVLGVAAHLLVQVEGDALRLPVAEEAFHVLHRVGFALDEVGRISDLFLAFGDAGDVVVHHLRADLHVPDRMVAEGFRVAFPHLDRVRHQLAHRGLEVIVADYTTGDARGPRADPGLVDDQDVGTVAPSAALQLQREVVRRAQSVDTRPDDQVLRLCGKHRSSCRQPFRTSGTPRAGRPWDDAATSGT